MGKGSTIAIILLIIVATLMYLLVEDETEWIEETTRVAKFNQLEKSSEELYRMRSRILSTYLRLRSNDKTYTIQRARGSNTKSGSLPNFFYRGTSYGIALFDESETNLHDLRDEIDKLNPTMVESVYFHSKESENDDEIVHEGYIVVFAHEPGAQHHDERDEWNVMWLARRSGQHYVFKWWAHVWGPPHKSDTYDHENLETFRHSHVMEALVPSNPKWSELAFHEEPVVGILDRNDEELSK